MATPRGAHPRDLEQRLRDLERRCAELANRVLAQRQLAVTAGDFVVSGGGSVLVKDGGGIVSEHTNGQTGIEFGQVEPAASFAHGLTLRGSDGILRCWFVEEVDGDWSAQLGGNSRPLASLNMLAQSVVLGAVDTTPQVTIGAQSILIDCSGAVNIGGSHVYVNHTTTSSAANARLDASTGELQRSTSSRRYKQDIETAEVDPVAVLALEPRTWRDRAEVSEDPDTETRYVGFIAEELDEAGLGLFVEYDDQGRPNAIQYDRLSAALLAVVKRQQQQLDDMESRLSRLELATG